MVDLHAITLPHEPKALLESTRKSAATYIACGIDPEKANIFVQSHVSAHAELAWLLSCGTPIGWLRKMVQFKEKSQTRVGLWLRITHAALCMLAAHCQFNQQVRISLQPLHKMHSMVYNL